MTQWCYEHLHGPIPVVSSAGRLGGRGALLLLPCGVAQCNKLFPFFHFFFNFSALSVSKFFKLFECSPCFSSEVKRSSHSALTSDGFSSVFSGSNSSPTRLKVASRSLLSGDPHTSYTILSVISPQPEILFCPCLAPGSFANVEGQGQPLP